ncbi:hypothetical protein EJ04DRAFT_342359 [Polyplosphaeria fusca]|uniref:Uncharacterized protein n=1 Tax=Polyplosphaeria fusca TaxID=682080 RepID=A0A9P4QV95_9PLEO|nr:hypothetical protein EJ04DRAFT_342359 [Polyplosphaeria fusca]
MYYLYDCWQQNRLQRLHHDLKIVRRGNVLAHHACTFFRPRHDNANRGAQCVLCAICSIQFEQRTRRNECGPPVARAYLQSNSPSNMHRESRSPPAVRTTAIGPGHRLSIRVPRRMNVRYRIFRRRGLQTKLPMEGWLAPHSNVIGVQSLWLQAAQHAHSGMRV